MRSPIAARSPDARRRKRLRMCTDGRCRLEDDYHALEIGSFPFDYGATGEYHALSPVGERGGWYEPAWWPNWSHGHWAVLVDSGCRELAHLAPAGVPGLLVREVGEWRASRVASPTRLMCARARAGL